MISAKSVVLIGIISLLISVGGFLLEIAGIGGGRYAIYLAVPVGAITVIVGAVAALLGKINNDLRE